MGGRPKIEAREIEAREIEAREIEAREIEAREIEAREPKPARPARPASLEFVSRWAKPIEQLLDQAGPARRLARPRPDQLRWSCLGLAGLARPA